MTLKFREMCFIYFYLFSKKFKTEIFKSDFSWTYDFSTKYNNIADFDVFHNISLTSDESMYIRKFVWVACAGYLTYS